MTEEPYRWLEAIQNRREYIRDQLKGGTPVFALSRPEGVLLLGVGQGQSKVFEIYDAHGLAVVGHPVDIERLRQAAIEAAHLEGFHRSSKDVTLRRLISFGLSQSLKASFEQIFSPPFMVEAIFAEVGSQKSEDVLARLHYDGNHQYDHSGVSVAHTDPRREQEGAAWIRSHLAEEASLLDAASVCLTVWQALVDDRPLAELTVPATPIRRIEGKTVEAALLDRRMTGPVHYRTLDLTQL